MKFKIVTKENLSKENLSKENLYNDKLFAHTQNSNNSYSKNIKYLPLLFKNVNHFQNKSINKTNNYTIFSNISNYKNINKIIINDKDLNKQNFIYYPNKGDLYLFINKEIGIMNNFIPQHMYIIYIICELDITNNCTNTNVTPIYEYYRSYYKIN